MSTVLVTGGAGFIGSYISEELAREGYSVRVLDVSGSKENLTGIKSEFIRGDITDLETVKKAMKGVEYVFHEAAMAEIGKSIENPIFSNKVNVDGTLNVLWCAKEAGVKKVIFAASSSVYGEVSENQLPIKETLRPSPGSPYAASKLIDEIYFDAFYKTYGMKYACLRYFNVYGPRQNANSQYAAVIPKMITRVLGGNPPIIFGDGKQTRDLVFVKDVARANILAMKKPAVGTFNIGSGKGISINELASKIIKTMGKKLEPIHAESRIGDARHSLADISLAKEKFGFYPKTDIDSGLNQTVNWFLKAA